MSPTLNLWAAPQSWKSQYTFNQSPGVAKERTKAACWQSRSFQCVFMAVTLSTKPPGPRHVSRKRCPTVWILSYSKLETEPARAERFFAYLHAQHRALEPKMAPRPEATRHALCNSAASLEAKHNAAKARAVARDRLRSAYFKAPALA